MAMTPFRPGGHGPARALTAPGHNRPVARDRQLANLRGDGPETRSGLDRWHVRRAPAHDGAGLPGERLRLAGQGCGTDDRQ